MKIVINEEVKQEIIKEIQDNNFEVLDFEDSDNNLPLLFKAKDMDDDKEVLLKVDVANEKFSLYLERELEGQKNWVPIFLLEERPMIQMPYKKKYVLKYVIVNGEHEYSQVAVCDSNLLQEEHIVHEYFKEIFYKTECTSKGLEYASSDGIQAIKRITVREISDKDYAVLKQYVGV